MLPPDPTGPFTPGNPPLASAAGPDRGDEVGPYKLLQPLGEGGMGEVWMAEQTHPVRRRVAVKLVKAGMDSRQVLARFEAERQALALMDHPNIAKVLDAGEAQGQATGGVRPYFVMELVKGLPITQFCDDERLTPRERLELFVPVCQAVQHAHQKGIIHRDLKPSNILVALYDGVPVPKVIDFGIAKALHQRLTDRTLFTEVGAIIGTLEYMAPEQAELNNLDVDTRADVYALGVVLYELLAGAPPFSGRDLRRAAYHEMLRVIREVEPPRPSTKLSGSNELRTIAARRKLDPRRLTREVHGDLDWIVMKCLEKDRGRRYDSANGLADDLRRHLSHEPVLAGPPRLSYRIGKWVRRKPAGAALVAVALVLPLLVTGLLLWHAFQTAELNRRIQAESDQAARDRDAARSARDDEKVQRDLAVERERLTRRHLYAATFGLYPRLYDSSRSEAVAELLDATRPDRTGGEDLRGWEWYHAHQATHQESSRFSGHGAPVQTAVFSPDGSRVASAGVDGTVIVWEPVTGAEVRRLPVSDSAVLALEFSPDGTRLAVACQNASAAVIDLVSGKRVFRLDGHALAVNHVAFSRDGQTLATAGADNVIKLWDGRTGRPGRTLVGHQGGVGRVWFHADGGRLASYGGDQTIRFWALPDGTEDRPALIRRVNGPCALNPDLTRVAVLADGKRRLTIADSTTKKPVAEWDAAGQPVQDIAYSPDGKYLAVVDEAGVVYLWNAETAKGLLSYRGWGRSVAFDPASTRMVCAGDDGCVKVWPVRPTTPWTLSGHDTPVRRLAFHPQGEVLASADMYGSIRLWDGRTGRHLRTLGIHIAERGPRTAERSEAYKAAAANGPPKNSVSFNKPAGTEYGPNELRTIWVFDGHPGEVTGMQFSPDGRTLASAGGDPTVRLWDVRTGKSSHVLHHPQRTSSVGFSPDGTRVVTGCWDDRLRVWDVTSAEELMSLEGHDDNVDATLFLRDGQRVVSAGVDGLVRVWDIKTRKCITQLSGHVGPVLCLALSADGRLLASGSMDETIRVWDVETGEVKSVLRGHTGRVSGVRFLPGRDRLLSTSKDEADGQARVWDLRIGQEIVMLTAPAEVIYDTALDPVTGRLAVTARRDIVFWDSSDPKATAPDAPRPVRAANPGPALVPTDEAPRVLGSYRVKDLPMMYRPETPLKPAQEKDELLVVVVSLPNRALYPTPAQYEAIQSRNRTDANKHPGGPLACYLLHDPARFALEARDGTKTPASAIAPLPFGYEINHGFHRGTIVESSTSIADGRQRSLLALVWEVPAGTAADARLRIDGGETLAIPPVNLDRYRGSRTSGMADQRAGDPRSRDRIVVARNFWAY